MVRLFLLIALNLVFTQWAKGQEKDKNGSQAIAPFATFKTTRVINAHSPETNFKRKLDFRVVHRFGDIAGDNGGYHSMFGIDNARDIRIAAEYGLTDDLDIGAGRSKGAGPRREIWDGLVKYRFLRQKEDFKLPFSATYLGTTAFTSVEESDQETSVNAFDNFTHRFSFTHQLIVGSRLSDRISLEVLPTYIHRNFVAHNDKNDIYALGAAGTFKISKMVGISAEYFKVWPENRGGNFRDPLAIGVEFETGGHVFHLNFTNSAGIGETQFIPYTRSSWFDGEFRFGFTISRIFQL